MTENRAVTSFLCICFSGCCSMEVAAAGACGCGRPGKAACEWVCIDTDLGDDDLPDVTDLFNSLVKDEHKLGGGNAAAAARTMNAYVHRAAEASLFGELKPDRVRLSNSKKHGHYHTSRVPAAGVAASELPGTYQATTGGADAGGAAEGGGGNKRKEAVEEPCVSPGSQGAPCRGRGGQREPAPVPGGRLRRGRVRPVDGASGRRHTEGTLLDQVCHLACCAPSLHAPALGCQFRDTERLSTVLMLSLQLGAESRAASRVGGRCPSRPRRRRGRHCSKGGGGGRRAAVRCTRGAGAELHRLRFAAVAAAELHWLRVASIQRLSQELEPGSCRAATRALLRRRRLFGRASGLWRPGWPRS